MSDGSNATLARRGVSEQDLRGAKREIVRRYLIGADGNLAVRASARHSLSVPGPDPVDNVVGVGIGDKVTHNQLVGEVCVKLYVRRKHLDSEIPPGERLPTTVEGISTDVEEVGLIRALQLDCSLQRRSRLRPAPCGVSVGHLNITAGTIGALARDSGRQDNGRRYILSNNHVLANSNNATPGDAIFQPGPLDGGSAPDRIADLARFVPIKFGVGENTVDCAAAELQDSHVLSDVCSIGSIRGTVRPERNMIVLKHGRTTGLTRGVITDVDADIRVDYEEAGIALFIDTVIIRGVPPTTPFSDGGDSGSTILNTRSRVCALLFAGSDTADVTFANPIRSVLRRLRIRLL
jgi:hypothetical protein